MSALLKAALEYADRGIPVFPLRTRGKAPRTKTGFKEATTDEKQIRAWWKKWPEANIGLYPGPADIVVVDIDGVKGLKFAEEHGWLDVPTPHVITAKGRHLFFRKPSDVVIPNAKLHPQIDVRGDKGYVVAPPSVHPSGHVYAWENEELEFAPLPEDVLPAVEAEKSTALVVRSGKIVKGTRNTRLTTYAGGLRRLGVGESGLLVALEALNNAECEPPLSKKEVGLIATSIARYMPARREGPVDRINSHFALLMHGGKAVVLWNKDDVNWTLLGFPDFKRLLENWPWVPISEQKFMHPAEYWLKHSDRRDYPGGVVFEPGELKTPGAFNIFRGWQIEPREGGKFDLFLDHIRENVCQGEARLYTWVVMWLAHIFQAPDRKIGTALVLRGGQGVGKTILGAVIGHLLGPYYQRVASSRYLVGNFNSHLENTLLLQAEEAFWAGQKDAEGVLKHLITSETNQIERKYLDPIQVANHVRVLITSNEGWVVPTGRDDRRFAVLDVGDARRNDRAFFGAMMHQLEEKDGYAGLLHHFLTLTIDEAVVRSVPHTAARTEQKHRSLSIWEECWLDILMRGVLPYDYEGDGWCLAPALLSHFEKKTRWAKSRKSLETVFGHFVKRVSPGVQKHRLENPETGGRSYFYEFPSLAECRRAFDPDADWPEPFEWQAANDDDDD